MRAGLPHSPLLSHCSSIPALVRTIYTAWHRALPISCALPAQPHHSQHPFRRFCIYTCRPHTRSNACQATLLPPPAGAPARRAAAAAPGLDGAGCRQGRVHAEVRAWLWCEPQLWRRRRRWHWRQGVACCSHPASAHLPACLPPARSISDNGQVSILVVRGTELVQEVGGSARTLPLCYSRQHLRACVPLRARH